MIETEVIKLWNKYPAVTVDFYRFVKKAALSDDEERPVTFTVQNDATSETRLTFSLTWPGADGEMYTVTSQRYPDLLWQAAGIQAQAWQRFKDSKEVYERPEELQIGLFEVSQNV